MCSQTAICSKQQSHCWISFSIHKVPHFVIFPKPVVVMKPFVPFIYNVNNMVLYAVFFMFLYGLLVFTFDRLLLLYFYTLVHSCCVVPPTLTNHRFQCWVSTRWISAAVSIWFCSVSVELICLLYTKWLVTTPFRSRSNCVTDVLVQSNMMKVTVWLQATVVKMCNC